MKLRLFIFSKQFFFLVLLFALFGCDQDDTPNYNYFKVGDKEYKIEECVITKNFVDDTSGVFSISFFDKQFEFQQTDSNYYTLDNYDGASILDFNLSPFTNDIKEGKYFIGSFDYDYGYGYGGGHGYPTGAGRFYASSLGLNWITSELKYEKFIYIESGELTLLYEGNNFDIKIICLDSNGYQAEGLFSGVPLVFKFKKKP